jgi:hypothetical protein
MQGNPKDNPKEIKNTEKKLDTNLSSETSWEKVRAEWLKVKET